MKKKKLNISLERLEPFFAKISKLTQVQRLLICVGTYALLIAPFIWLSYLPKYEKIGNLEKEFSDLDSQLQIAKRKAAQLKRFQVMLKEAQGQFELAKRKLPQAREIPDLLANITASGQASGLEFYLFQPKGEVAKGFYAEIPVSISVRGDYGKVAQFFDKLAGLSRIVNIRNIRMRPADDTLDTSCTAVTYMFIEKG
jgi:type IV pilus assembly protein PilO